MAKVAFSKLNCKLNDSCGIVLLDDYDIEVKQYLPINNKLELVSYIINNSIEEDKGYYNEGKLLIYLTLGTMFYYTNINFTDKQKSDVCKLYDLVVSSGLYNKIYDIIPEEEKMMVYNTLRNTINSIYEYRNSVMGILDTVSSDYSNLDLNASKIQKELADPENMSLLRQVLDKLG